MVECMEAWFLADRAALLRFYGQGFNENALPATTTNPEQVRKVDLYESKMKVIFAEAQETLRATHPPKQDPAVVKFAPPSVRDQ